MTETSVLRIEALDSYLCECSYRAANAGRFTVNVRAPSDATLNKDAIRTVDADYPYWRLSERFETCAAIMAFFGLDPTLASTFSG